jgi:L-iditol 2-dehydrogenase
MGFQTQGTASDYFIVDQTHVVALPDTMDLRFGAMIEPLAVAVRAITKAGDLCKGRVLVMGAGPIGNFVAQVAKASGAEQVMICDTNPLRLAKALECGVDIAVNLKDKTLKDAIDYYFGSERKADVIFDCAGTPSAISSAIQSARKGSTIVLVAVYGSNPQIDLARINECELNILGTARYTFDDFDRAIELVSHQAIELEALITDVYELPEYQRAYEKIEKAPDQIMKVLIHVHTDDERSKNI